MSETNDRIAFRPTPADVANLAAVAEDLRRRGDVFATRTDCLRHALALAAGAATKSPAECAR